MRYRSSWLVSSGLDLPAFQSTSHTLPSSCTSTQSMLPTTGWPARLSVTSTSTPLTVTPPCSGSGASHNRHPAAYWSSNHLRHRPIQCGTTAITALLLNPLGCSAALRPDGSCLLTRMSSSANGVSHKCSSTSRWTCSATGSSGKWPVSKNSSTRSWNTLPAIVDHYVVPDIRARREIYHDRLHPRDLLLLSDNRIFSVMNPSVHLDTDIVRPHGLTPSGLLYRA